MADYEKTVEIVFGAVDETGGAVRSVGDGISGLADSAGSVTGPLANLAYNALQTEAAIIAMAAAMAGVAVNEAGQFRSSVAEIGTLFGASADQLDQFSGQILNFAQDSTAGLDQINQAIYTAISTGTDWADSLGFVGQAEQLAVAGAADLGDATALLARTLNAYGLDVGEAERVSDALFTTVQGGDTTVALLASSLGQVAATAAAAGVDVETLLSGVAGLTTAGVSTSESMTGLKALLSELLDPGEDLAAALGDVSVQSDGLAGVMTFLQEKTGGAADEMFSIFSSSEAAKAAIILANDSAGTFADTLDAMGSKAGNTAKAYELMAQQFTNVNSRLWNNVTTTFIQVGEPLLDDYAEIATALGEMFKGVKVSIARDAFAEVYDSIDDFSDDLAEQMLGIAAALPDALEGIDFTGLLNAFGLLGDNVSDLFGDLDLTKAEDLEKAIQFLVDSIESLTRVSADIVDGLAPFFSALVGLVEKINESDDATKALAGQILGLATGVDAVLPAVSGLGDVLATVGGGLAVIGGAKSAGAATKGLAGVAAALSGPAGVTAALSAAGVAGYALGSAIEDMTGIGSKLGSWIYDLVNGSNDLAQSVTKSSVSMATATEKVDDYVHGQKILAVANRDSNLSFEEQVERVSRNAEIMDNLDEINRKGVESTKEVATQVRAARLSFDLLTESEKQNLSTQEKINLAVKRYADQSGYAVTETGKLYRVNEELADSTDKVTVAADKQAAAQKRQNEEIVKTEKAAQEYQLKLEEFASNERIRGMELKFDLNLEALEQEGEKAKAIIAGIGTSVESTGGLIGDLFGTLADDNLSRTDQLDLERQIDKENDRRDDALEQQAKLVGAQTELLGQQAKLAEARAKAVKDGDRLIKVEAEGLTPALDIVFTEILKYAQVQATQEGAEFLTGLPS